MIILLFVHKVGRRMLGHVLSIRVKFGARQRALSP